MATARGRLITIEGLDGAGKSTLAVALAAAWPDPERPVELLREPGGVPTSERIRALVKDPSLTVGARTEALLYAAARAQLVEQALEPLLSRGTDVLLDRFVDSSLAYQGGGRELGLDPVHAINDFATGGLRPDLTLLLMLDPRLGRRRAAARGQPDRLESEAEPFFGRVASAYAQLAAEEPDRFRLLDAARAPREVLAAALAALAPVLAR